MAYNGNDRQGFRNSGRNRSGGFNRFGDLNYNNQNYVDLDNDLLTSGYDNDFDDFDIYDEPATWTYTEYWLVPGPFVGVGPRDYQRSDERIYEDVCKRLSLNGQLDASDITANVDKGEVYLEGSVNSRHDKRLAEDIADSVMGVVDVHNDLKIKKTNHSNQGQSQLQSGQQMQSQQQGQLGSRQKEPAN